jgi:hypothetical protein
MQRRSARLAEAQSVKAASRSSGPGKVRQKPQVAKPKPEAEESVHCARYHQSYRPGQNVGSAFRIDHYTEDMKCEHSRGG